MQLTPEVKASIDKSVLCWLATISGDDFPNVSPKEIFQYYDTDKIIVANIASPQTVKNIQQNKNVCISFIDILVQKGYQVKGTAEIIGASHPDFFKMEKALLTMTDGKFPFKTISCITVQKVKPILAPRYLLFPETTEAEQIKSARALYGI